MITLLSVAKINLFLKINSTITDGKWKGYHNIWTLFYPLKKIHDTITIKEGKFKLSCNHIDVPTDERNLVTKTIRLFEKESGFQVNLQFHIDKKIPVAGGMAGGSSNAGTVFHFLNRYYKTNFSYKKLVGLCSQIGADVPFFLNPKPSLATGIGEDLEEISFFHFPFSIVIFTFSFGITAKWAYENFSNENFAGENFKNSHLKNSFFSKKKFSKKEFIQILQEKDKIQSVEKLEKKRLQEKFSQLIENDLSPIIFNHYPILQKIKDILYQNQALKVEISGSGPSLFAIFESQQDAELAMKKVPQKEIQKAFLI